MLLMTPGPTRVPEPVLRAGAREMMHHRSPEFSAELGGMLQRLRPLFGTRGDVLPVHATGRGAMEATLCNLFSAGDEIAVCCNGRFGEMWCRIADPYGLRVHRIAADWNVDIDPAEVDGTLAAHPAIRGIALAHSDTSTGVANDVAAIARVARARNVLVLVDGVSSIGGMPFAFDEWGVDAAITASQKCLMSAPGLSFAVLSERAWSANASAKLPRSYWNFASIRRDVTKDKPETPGTPPVHVVLQVAEALRLIHTEGLDAVHHRHAEMSGMTQRGAAALGLAPQCPALTRRSTTLTAIALPPEHPPQQVRDGLKARGILTAAGLEEYRATSFRIGHMGDIRPADVLRSLAALGDVLGSR
jgi:aspartate aminotransferase-like enzyme